MKRILTVIAALALAACTQQPLEPGQGPEAGGELNASGVFGNATLNNMAVHSGSQNYAIDLNRRFAASVPTMINFAFDSAVLDAEARGILNRQAHFIRQFPEVRFKVFGHTDLVGSAAYNQNLGLRRAQAVVQYLATQGISTSRLEAVVSFGQTQPLIATPARERRNRRTVTEVTGFVASHPMILNGKYAEVIFREYVNSAVPPQTVESQVTSAGAL